jgi:ubiquinol-cytochrome c reductase iron-sulfur subunit
MDRPTGKDCQSVNSTASAEHTRGDFLFIATGGAGAAAATSGVWPRVSQMNPDASTIAAGAPVEVDLSPIAARQVIEAFWRGKPIFVSQMTAKDIAAARSVDVASLPVPLADQDRVKQGHDQSLVVVGTWTLLGCIPLAHQGDFGGWFCPCHGSQYDTSAWIRRGPAPANPPLPPYKFDSDTTIQIG